MNIIVWDLDLSLSPILITLLWSFATGSHESGGDHMLVESASLLCDYSTDHFQVRQPSLHKTTLFEAD